ncbi:hypothetical protein ACQP0C_32145 [Nocardia sp. CA-129566]|uniref:hypothetical protein n=1 Tax=Nocardia sp. CA-129566 TaxID=3239976 RepID=UPI003D9595FD
MGEEFLAKPSEIGGLAKIVSEIGNDATEAGKFISRHGPAADWLSGPIIDQLLAPVRIAAEATQRRMGDIGIKTIETGSELNKAAWLYHNQDQHTYEALNQHKVNLGHRDVPVPVYADREADGHAVDYESAAVYSKPEEFKLDVPQANKEDTAALITEVAPVLGNVNEAIKSITRMAGHEVDPLGEALKPIPGNWNEVRRIGEAYKAAGNGMEACGKNLEAGVSRVDQHWNGKAATSFSEWAQLQIAAMKWEGPVGRVVSDALGVVADKIREAVKTILTKVWEMLEERVDFRSVKGAIKTIAHKIPGAGTAAEIADIGRKLIEIITTAIDLVKKVEILRDRVKSLLEIVSDPLGTARDKVKQKLDQTLEPITSAIDDATKKAAIAKDVSEIAQLDHTLDRPQQDYEIGSGNQPWENA